LLETSLDLDLEIIAIVNAHYMSKECGQVYVQQSIILRAACETVFWKLKNLAEIFLEIITT
jgi:hypothetical protein